MAELHIEDFCKDSARILLALYRAFPRPIALYVEEISGPETVDEYGLPGPRSSACFATMLWLAGAGYLHYDATIGREAIEQAVLSHLGFTLLSAPPEDGQGAADQSVPAGEHSNAAKLKRSLQRDSSTTLAEHVLTLLRQAHRFR